MRQSLAQQPVGKCPKHGACQKDNQHGGTTAHQDKHGPRTNSCERPAQTKNEAANDVSGYAFVFGMEYNFLSFDRPQVPALDPLYHHDAYSNGRKNNAVHVK